ncbi:hypothetical protein FHG87_013297 [Trinorchestia longiramus]|nr:hypothetical protein FHG87_013297 [Trinorchestia longiramus]
MVAVGTATNSHVQSTQTVRALNTTVHALNTTVRALNTTVRALNATVRALNATVRALNATVGALNATVGALNATVRAVNTTVREIFNPDYPFSELDFINDFDMSSYETMGLGNDNSNNHQQVSLYNPSPMDLAALVDSPTEDDLSEDEPFAMASFDPEFITTPKVDTVGNNRKRIRDETSDGCNDDLHPLLKDLC